MCSIAEIFTGAGFMVGPIIGSGLYSLGGYTMPFIVSGTLNLLIAPLVYGYVQKSYSRSLHVSPISSEVRISKEYKSLIEHHEKPIGYLTIMLIYKTDILVWIVFIANIVFTF